MGYFKISCTIVLLFITVNLFGQYSTSLYPARVANISLPFDKSSYTVLDQYTARIEGSYGGKFYRYIFTLDMGNIPANAVISDLYPIFVGTAQAAGDCSIRIYIVDTTQGYTGTGNIVGYYELTANNGVYLTTSQLSFNSNYFVPGTNRKAIIITEQDYNNGSAMCTQFVDIYGYESNYRWYIVYNLPPSIPTLSSPSSGSTNQSVTPTLSWNASSSGTPTISYVLQVSASSSFSTIAYTTTTTSLSATTTTLLNNTLYYWRVYATNAYGTSSYSSVNSFTTQAAVTGSDDTSELQSIMGEK